MVLGKCAVVLGLGAGGLGIELFLLGIEGPSLIKPPHFLLSTLSS